jgi:hypothetical protein
MKPERSVILLLLALCPHAHAQEFPGAPSALVPPTAESVTLVTPVYRHPRGHKKLLALAGVVGFETLADHYDVSETEKGLKAGVAVEKYTWLVGSKPSAGRLYARDMLEFGIVTSPTIIGYLWRRAEFYYGGLGAPTTLAVKHIYAGNGWRRLLKGAAPTGSELGP